MWTAAGGVIVVLVAIAGALWGGVKYGETKQKKKDAEGKAEDMAHDAAIAARPPVDNPFSAMRGKD